MNIIITHDNYAKCEFKVYASNDTAADAASC